MVDIIFAVLVVVGFIFWFFATFPNAPNWSERVARGFFLAASVVFAYMLLTTHTP
jgi:hypothetical protein